MPDPLDDPAAAQRGQCEAGEITAEDETGHGRSEILDRDPQGDQGIKKAVGELDTARREDERPDLRAHRRSLRHQCSNEKNTRRSHQAQRMVIEGLRAAQDLRPIIPSISTVADSRLFAGNGWATTRGGPREHLDQRTCSTQRTA
jgi:hypothetical protein